MKNPQKFRSFLLASVLTSLVWAASSVSAQTCTLDNWTSSVKTGDTLLAASRAQGNKAYAGPCSLKVTLNSSAAYLVDDTPTAETTFNVRFYFFLQSVGADVTLFEALDASDNSVMSATYDQSANLVNVVFEHSGGTETVPIGPLTTGWNSLEIQWEAKAAERAVVSLGNSATASNSAGSAEIDTSALTIGSVRLGAIPSPATVPSSGVIFFDDYDSRRDTVPGRLCRGLTDSSRSALNLEDVQAIFAEFATGGGSPASGTPDYDQNGSVDLQDVSDVFSRFATGQNACSANS